MEKEIADQIGESFSAGGEPDGQADAESTDQVRKDEDLRREEEEEEEEGERGAALNPEPEEYQAVDDGFEEGLEPESLPVEEEEEELLTADDSPSDSDVPRGGASVRGLSAQEVTEALLDLGHWREGAGGRPEAPTEDQSSANVSSEELEGIDRGPSRERPLALQREPGAAQNHPVKQPAGEPRRVQADSQRQLQLQGLLDNLERENRDLQMLCGVLKQEKSELAWTVKELQGQLQSSSQERLSLKSQLDHLGEDETGGGSRRKLSGRALDLAVMERAQKADQEAALAKAQLIAVLEKYDRVEKDNQSMADEIHHFREEIGRLRQRPSRSSCYRNRLSMMGLVFLFGLFYYWCIAEELK